MKKAMLSQPMGGKTEAEIRKTKDCAVAVLTSMGYEIADTLYTDAWYQAETADGEPVIHRPLFFLAKSLEEMSRCDAVYFCKGWRNARGCRIEHEAAVSYGLEIIYE